MELIYSWVCLNFIGDKRTNNIDTVIFSDTTAENVVELMRQFAESTNPRLSNLATIFLEVRELHGRLKTPAWVVSQLNHQILNFNSPNPGLLQSDS